jgi:hypothetical protein
MKTVVGADGSVTQSTNTTTHHPAPGTLGAPDASFDRRAARLAMRQAMADNGFMPREASTARFYRDDHLTRAAALATAQARSSVALARFAEASGHTRAHQINVDIQL